MIDVQTETLIPIGQVPAEIPSRRPGKKVNISTVWRWAMRGCRGIQLETVVIGGGRFTSRQAVQRFAERLSEARDSLPAVSASRRTVAQRHRADSEAARQLIERGA